MRGDCVKGRLEQLNVYQRLAGLVEPPAVHARRAVFEEVPGHLLRRATDTVREQQRREERRGILASKAARFFSRGLLRYMKERLSCSKPATLTAVNRCYL